MLIHRTGLITIAYMIRNANGFGWNDQNRLYNKESNRLEATCMMLAQLGVRFEIRSDTLFVHGGFHYRNGMVLSHHDHRIVLAAIVAAHALETVVAVDEMEAIKKSYPEMKQFLSLKGI